MGERLRDREGGGPHGEDGRSGGWLDRTAEGDRRARQKADWNGQQDVHQRQGQHGGGDESEGRPAATGDAPARNAFRSMPALTYISIGIRGQVDVPFCGA